MVEYSKKIGISQDLIPVLKGYFNLSNAYFGKKSQNSLTLETFNCSVLFPNL